MIKKVVIAGGTGFVGTYLETKFRQLGYEVAIISRQPSHIAWDDLDGIVQALEHAQLLINLAGKSVDCRYNDRNKEEIMRSRTETTAILGKAVSACTHPPAVWMNSSTATIYRHAVDRPMTESGGDIGSGFSVEVAQAWERTFFSCELPSTRQIALRIAIVLGKHGGVMTPYKHLVRYGLGGIQGPGTQKFSWIHIEDLFQIILFLLERDDLSGVFNCSSPYPVTNKELMQQLRTAMNRPFGLPAPAWLLELGAWLIRTETELILKSRWVVPERLTEAGYAFRFPRLDQTLQNLVR
ncbi:TIGR01777 family oxidoreductase [Paenibacillus rigui]|uniref:TIGR01777 family protein n=1 Tax=Paenibacillus rigui TaxID=554312 RepID=A0A229UHT2_9BACL|nr:TIGR01777 family oxidoreductase [Paenibacillus rigui]OXM82933.1 TIGR01777 family protein [Paenibacillus rigui]